MLTTGAAGFIGSTLSAQLLALGHEVTAVDNFNDYYDPRYKRENIEPLLGKKGYTLYEGDICNKRFLSWVFRQKKFDRVVHLAASVGVRNSLLHPKLYHDTNVGGTRALLHAAVKHDVSQFIFASSSSVYGNNSPIPFREDVVVDSPLSPYAQTKKEAEAICKTYHDTYGIPVTVFRFFTVYGPKGRPDMSPYIFTDSILRGKHLTVFGDGSTKRDFTYIDDIVHGIALGAQKSFPYEVFNLGASSPIDMVSFIRTLERLAHKKADIIFAPPVPSEMKHTYADIRKAKKLLGYQPKTTVEEGLGLFIRWFKNNRM